MPGRCVDNLINAGQREVILRTRVVKVRVVYAYPPLASFIQNYHHVSKPFQVFHFSDKHNLQKVIYLSLDDLMAVWVEAPYSLPNRSGGCEDVQLVGGIHGLIPVMSKWTQANTSVLAFSTSCNWALSSSVRRELT